MLAFKAEPIACRVTTVAKKGKPVVSRGGVVEARPVDGEVDYKTLRGKINSRFVKTLAHLAK